MAAFILLTIDQKPTKMPCFGKNVKEILKSALIKLVKFQVIKEENIQADCIHE